jgi:bifunctional DNA-binding transcriptional regulator/antitoxin component of YhaV-PrlF toxin-antitoxin module
MNLTTIIRQRGQLTIPEKARKEIDWLKEGSVVNISNVDSKKLTITPYQKISDKVVSWKKIWHTINLARSFKGKRGNLSGFVADDRNKH